MHRNACACAIDQVSQRMSFPHSLPPSKHLHPDVVNVPGIVLLKLLLLHNVPEVPAGGGRHAAHGVPASRGLEKAPGRLRGLSLGKHDGWCRPDLGLVQLARKAGFKTMSIYQTSSLVLYLEQENALGLSRLSHARGTKIETAGRKQNLHNIQVEI